jgi:DNA-binding CsgD family transcriptional regulator
MTGRRKFEQSNDALVAKIHKLRGQGLSHALIGERLGLNRRQVEALAKRAVNK